MSDSINVGEVYALDELPDNDMNESGKVEWVGDNLLALAHDDKTYEFEMAVKCTAITRINDDGTLEVIDGKTR